MNGKLAVSHGAANRPKEEERKENWQRRQLRRLPISRKNSNQHESRVFSLYSHFEIGPFPVRERKVGREGYFRGTHERGARRVYLSVAKFPPLPSPPPPLPRGLFHYFLFSFPFPLWENGAKIRDGNV